MKNIQLLARVEKEKLSHMHTLSRAYKNISNSILSYSFQKKISKCLRGEIHDELILSRLFMSQNVQNVPFSPKKKNSF